MLKYIAQKAFAKFGRTYDYDMSYLMEMAEFYPAKTWRYLAFLPLSTHFSAVPKELYYAVKIVASRLADCGICTELEISIAIEAGVDRRQLSFLIVGDVENMSSTILLGYKYANAVAQNNIDLLEIIDHIKIEYGKKGLWDVATAYNFGEFYPKLKRGLGEAVSCRTPKDMVEDILNGRK